MARFWAKHKDWISLVVGLVAIYSVLYALGITCILKFLTGISCPGCGMTRACMHAAKLDFEAAFAYHPLWVGVLPVGVLFLIFQFTEKKTASRVLFAIVVLALLVVYFYRMQNPDGTVIVFAPEQAYFYDTLSSILDPILKPLLR